MKKFLISLGVVFLILILTAAGFLVYFACVGTGLDASSKAYVDASVPAIVAHWSASELIKRASPQLRAATPDQEIDAFFMSLAQKSGSFQSYDGSKGDSMVSYTTQNGKTITASYTASATFQNGKVDIQVKLIQIKGAWSLLGFHVSRHSPPSLKKP